MGSRIASGLRFDLSEPRFLAQWRRAGKHVEAHYLHGGRAPTLGLVVELGTGADPVVPLGLALSGARQVLSFDPAPPTSVSVVSTLKLYRRLLLAGRLPSLEPDAVARIDCALGSTRDPAGLLEAFGVQVRQDDVHSAGLAPDSVDLFISSHALGLIGVRDVRALFREFRRLGRDDAVMSHFVERSAKYRDAHRDSGWIVLEDDAAQGWLTASPAPAITH